MAAGLLVAGLVLAGPAYAQEAPRQPTVEVSGSGSVSSPPDIARIGYTVRGEGRTSDAAVQALVALGVRTDAAVRQVDRQSEITTSRMSILEVRDAKCGVEGRFVATAESQLSEGLCAITGYVATQSVTVRIGRPVDAGTLVGALGRAGARGPNIQGFELADPEAARQIAVKSAYANALAKARALTVASGSRLGAVVKLSSGETGYRARAIDFSGASASPYADRIPPIKVTMAPEPIQTTAIISVIFALER